MRKNVGGKLNLLDGQAQVTAYSLPDVISCSIFTAMRLFGIS